MPNHFNSKFSYILRSIPNPAMPRNVTLTQQHWKVLFVTHADGKRHIMNRVCNVRCFFLFTKKGRPYT